MDKILFICEGAKTEKRFCNLIIDKYFIQKQKVKEFVAFETNIYGLYDEMSRDLGLDIVELIKEKAKQKKDMYNYSKLSSGGFSEVYLIFDFDFHAPQYDSKKIIKMLDLFDNETEHGKLYINYPMIESFKHFKSIPDYDFYNYKVKRDDCVNYKEQVGKFSIIPHFGDITEEVLGIIIKQNLIKYSIISKKEMNNYSDYINFYSQINLLTYQLKNLKNNDEIFVFNTSLLWGIDYFGEEKFNEYIEILV